MSEILLPSIEAIKEATYKAFAGKVKDDHIEKLLQAVDASSFAVSNDTSNYYLSLDFDNPATYSNATEAGSKWASASLYFLGFWGVTTCDQDDDKKRFEASTWGVGASGVMSKGLLYHACNSWDDFYNNTRYFHSQGVAYWVGGHQITFMDSDHTLIGQYNGASGGGAIFETGGGGRWENK